jgi:hypothetical protein
MKMLCKGKACWLSFFFVKNYCRSKLMFTIANNLQKHSTQLLFMIKYLYRLKC